MRDETRRVGQERRTDIADAGGGPADAIDPLLDAELGCRVNRARHEAAGSHWTHQRSGRAPPTRRHCPRGRRGAPRCRAAW